MFPITQMNPLKICANQCLQSKDSLLILFVVLCSNLRQPLVLDEYSFCGHNLFIFYSQKLAPSTQIQRENLEVSIKFFKVLFYPLVKYYCAASYRDKLLPSILAVCINISLLTQKTITSKKKVKSVGQRLYASGCWSFP